MTFTFTPTDIPDVILIQNETYKDDRGYFAETYRKDVFNELGLPDFVQDNVSHSSRGTLRGLHYQLLPNEQAKLISCVSGYIVDVAVDIRKESKTFGKYVKVELFDPRTMLYVPAGFCHGFLALEDNTIVSYRCSDYYSPEQDRNIHWNDPQINIDWGFDLLQIKVSDKDDAAPLLKDAELV